METLLGGPLEPILAPLSGTRVETMAESLPGEEVAAASASVNRNRVAMPHPRSAPCDSSSLRCLGCLAPPSVSPVHGAVVLWCRCHQPLELSAPDMPSLKVPVMRRVGPGGPGEGGEVVEVRVWGDTCRAVDQGNTVALWLRAFLDVVGVLPARLSRLRALLPRRHLLGDRLLGRCRRACWCGVSLLASALT